MRVDDFIVFGRTAPEDSKKYGQSVCMAGYSEELRQLLRLYPMNIRSKVRARCKISVEIERNNKDSRFESWTLKDRTEDSILNVSSPIDKDAILPILKKNAVESIKELNEKRLSLGIIKPEKYEIQLKTRANIAVPGQLTLFDSFRKSVGVKTANNYFHAPYLRIYADDSQSCLQIREWGIYELIRRYEKEGKAITDQDIKRALHIGDGKDAFFIIGNMVSVRNVWLVIKVFTYDKQPQNVLF